MFSQKQWLAVIISVIILTSSITAIVTLAVTTSPSVLTISSGNYPGAPDYTFWKESTITYVKDHNGETFGSGANSSVLIRDALGNASINGGVSLFFKNANYEISMLQNISISRVLIYGEGWNTVFTIDAGAGFNLSSVNSLYDISFEHLQFYSGGPTADYAITSAMGTNRRISGLEIRDCWFDTFNKAGAIVLNLTNLEVSTITNNVFYRTNTSFIQLIAYQYASGNNKIFDNVFYLGYGDGPHENAIRVIATGGNSTYSSESGNVYSWGNQWWGGSVNTTYAWNLTVTGSYCNVVTIVSSGDRYEGINVVWSRGYDSSNQVKHLDFHDDVITASALMDTTFDFDNFTLNSKIHDNIVLLQPYTTFVNISGLYTTALGNQIYNNNLGNNNLFINATSATVCYGNALYNPIGKFTNWKGTAGISPWGYSNSLTAGNNGTTFTITTCPIYLTSAAGTGLNITITDGQGNQLSTGATTVTNLYLPIGYGVTWVFATAPTVTVYGV